jgi:hypothetical protein
MIQISYDLHQFHTFKSFRPLFHLKYFKKFLHLSAQQNFYLSGLLRCGHGADFFTNFWCRAELHGTPHRKFQTLRDTLI